MELRRPDALPRELDRASAGTPPPATPPMAVATAAAAAEVVAAKVSRPSGGRDEGVDTAMVLKPLALDEEGVWRGMLRRGRALTDTSRRDATCCASSRNRASLIEPAGTIAMRTHASSWSELPLSMTAQQRPVTPPHPLLLPLTRPRSAPQRATAGRAATQDRKKKSKTKDGGTTGGISQPAAGASSSPLPPLLKQPSATGRTGRPGPALTEVAGGGRGRRTPLDAPKKGRDGAVGAARRQQETKEKEEAGAVSANEGHQLARSATSWRRVRSASRSQVGRRAGG